MVNLNPSLTSSIVNFNNKYVSPYIAEPGLRMYDCGNYCKSYNTIKESFCARSYLNCLVEIPFLMKHIVCLILDHIPICKRRCKQRCSSLILAVRGTFNFMFFGVAYPGLADRVIEKKIVTVKDACGFGVSKVDISLKYFDGEELNLNLHGMNTVLDLKKYVAELKSAHWCDLQFFVKGEQECLCDALRLDSLVAVNGVISLFSLPRENKDKEALIAFLESGQMGELRLQVNGFDHNWRLDTPFGDWIGVELDEGARVTKLVFYAPFNYRLPGTGVLPADLDNLPALEMVQLIHFDRNPFFATTTRLFSSDSSLLFPTRVLQQQWGISDETQAAYAQDVSDS